MVACQIEKELGGVIGMFDRERKFEGLPVSGSIAHQLLMGAVVCGVVKRRVYWKFWFDKV